jgi:hypothetical protein
MGIRWRAEMNVEVDMPLRGDSDSDDQNNFAFLQMS